MSLSNRDIENLKTRLNRNSNLSPSSKTNLNRFIENTKNAFDRTAYNTRMRNLKIRDASLGNLNSAMENSNGSVSRGSVNPRKRGLNSPTGVLSAVSGASSISNNENTASTKKNLERTAKRQKNNSQPRPPPVTVAQAAGSKQKANYEKLRIKRNSLPRGLYNIFSNTRLQNAVNQGRYQNMNNQIISKIKLANNNERRIKNQLSKISNGNFKRNVQSKINNVIGNNNKTNALLQQINTKAAKVARAAAATQAAKNANANAARARANAIAARARYNAIAAATQAAKNAKAAKAAKAANVNANANANAAKNASANANTRVNAKINNNKNIINLINLRDILEFKLTKTQLIEIAKSVGKNPKNKDIPKLANMIMANNKNIEKVKKQLNRDTEFTQITKKVNQYISSIPNNNRIRPEYTASLVSLFIKDLPLAVRTKILSDNHSKLPEIMKGINQRCIPSTPINIEKNISSEEFTDLVFIMWLDGVHDKYITKTLDTWFNETTLFSDTQKELVVEGWDTPFIRIINSLELTKARGPKILTSSLKNFPAQWEKKIKKYLSETKYKNSATNYKFQTRIPKRVSTPNPQNINIAIDQEYDDSNEQSITRFIKNHTRANNSTTDVNTLITYGQAFDPGRSMVGGGVHEDIEMLTQNQIPKNYISDTKKYYLCDLNINLVVDNIPVYKIRLKKDKSNNVNMSFNSKKIFGGVTAAQAKSAKGDIIPVSKYFGDALQYFYIAAMNDVQRTESPKTERFFFGSGDSVALLGYDRVCKILNNSVRMVIDFPSKNDPEIHVIGLDATITNRPQPAASAMTGTGQKNNNSGEVISGSRANANARARANANARARANANARARANANANANARARARAAKNAAAKAKRQERELKQLGVSPTQGPRTRARSN